MDYLRIKNFPGIQPYAIWWHTIPRNFWPSFIKTWCGILKIWQKMLIFGPFLTLIPYNPVIKNFFQKSDWNIFYSYQDTTLCKVSEKSDERFSRYGVTHARTHTRTTLNALVFRHKAERPINSLHITKLDHTTSTIWKKLAWPKTSKAPFYHHMQCILTPKNFVTRFGAF